ncbi:MAG: acyl-CoA synthetase (AMP-forming)/AMP-acid ligase II [Halieaceae bacterium]
MRWNRLDRTLPELCHRVRASLTCKSVHDSILEAAVFVEPDEKAGKKVLAYITVKSEISERDTIAHCKVLLMAYEKPKKIVFMQELPILN